MSWALLAAAAAGLNAGSGLHCALMDSQPSPTSDPALAESFWQVSRSKAASKVTLSSTLSSVAAAASLAAYIQGGDAADPAYITCAIISAVIPLYNAIVMSPTASVVSSKVMDQGERASWLASFQRKSWIATGAALAAFGCTLLVMGSDTVGGTAGNRTANPFRV